jgi:uncharacterized protein (DUF488 family)
MEKKQENLICYTIGHSVHNTNEFIELLKKHNIKYIVDVRSTPYSQYTPQFNRESLKTYLENSKIGYIYMGDVLGARYNNPELFFNNQTIVNFQKVSKLPSFKKGIERVIDGIQKGYVLALMCAEKDPFDCHRFILVSHELTKSGVCVLHIMENGELQNTETLEKRLLSKYKIDYQQSTLFEKFKS